MSSFRSFCRRRDMIMPCQTTRPAFLKSASAGPALSMTALGYGRIRGANDRLGIAVIGGGSQGFRAHMRGVHRHAEAMNVEIRAIADPWRPRRRRMSTMQTGARLFRVDLSRMAHFRHPHVCENSKGHPMRINRRNKRAPLPHHLIFAVLFWGSLLSPPWSRPARGMIRRANGRCCSTAKARNIGVVFAAMVFRTRRGPWKTAP